MQKKVNPRRYFLAIFTCRACNLKPHGTTGKGQRKMIRWEHADKIQSIDALMASTPESMLIRKQTLAHPFGTIKSWMGLTHFITRRFKNISTEMNLHVLAYNLTRMIKIKGTQGLICAMQTQ